jgi:hypothetical protein
VYQYSVDWDKAQYYAEQSVANAKLMKEGDVKLKTVFNSLSELGKLYQWVGKFTESKDVRIEAYELVSMVHDPEHPMVLEAGSNVIKINGELGEHYDAERFARICYEGLNRHGLDPESYEATSAAIDLAKATFNLIKTNGPENANIVEGKLRCWP